MYKMTWVCFERFLEKERERERDREREREQCYAREEIRFLNYKIIIKKRNVVFFCFFFYFPVVGCISVCDIINLGLYVLSLNVIFFMPSSRYTVWQKSVFLQL